MQRDKESDAKADERKAYRKQWMRDKRLGEKKDQAQDTELLQVSVLTLGFLIGLVQDEIERLKKIVEKKDKRIETLQRGLEKKEGNIEKQKETRDMLSATFTALEGMAGSHPTRFMSQEECQDLIDSKGLSKIYTGRYPSEEYAMIHFKAQGYQEKVERLRGRWSDVLRQELPEEPPTYMQPRPTKRPKKLGPAPRDKLISDDEVDFSAEEKRLKELENPTKKRDIKNKAKAMAPAIVKDGGQG